MRHDICTIWGMMESMKAIIRQQLLFHNHTLAPWHAGTIRPVACDHSQSLFTLPASAFLKLITPTVITPSRPHAVPNIRSSAS